MKITGEILKELREDRDFNQQEIADVIGKTQPQYSRYEKGDEISFQSAILLSEFYKVPLDYLSGKAYERFMCTHDPEEWRNVSENYTYEELFVDVSVLGTAEKAMLIKFVKFLKSDKNK